MTAVPGLPTPVTFCEIFPPDDFPLYFYRYPKAPDLEIRAEELDLDAIRVGRVFWVTVTGLSQEPSRSATLAALEARAKSGITILDLDYRPMFWPSREAARRGCSGPWSTSRSPSATSTSATPPSASASRGGRRGPARPRGRGRGGQAGPQGRAGADAGTEVEVPPVPVEVVNGLGAGDAFGGALCHGLLAGWDLERLMRFCNAAGALVASRLACADAMPEAAEVEALLEEAVNAG